MFTVLMSMLFASNDARLVHRVARGDERALRALYDVYAAKLLAATRRILGNLGEAEEVVQDTFVDVWNKAASFDSSRGSPASWLFAIGRNRAIDRIRARATVDRVITEIARETPVLSSTPDRDIEQAQTRRLVSRALDRLSPDQRVVIELAYFDGLSQSEIAARTGSPLGTIKGRARAALERLAESLSEEVV